jgi:cell division transport system ATP-binding protein
VIEFEDVGFRYDRTFVLRGTSLAFAPGTLNILLGAPASGKSTLLRLGWLDLAPSEGRIRHRGRTVAPRDRAAIAALRRAIGVLPQRSQLMPHLTVAANVALPLRAVGVPPQERHDDLQALLEWVDLRPLAEALPSALSRGERRRAALARAIILSPDLILADDPADGIDTDSADRMAGLLVELNRMGKTVVVACQDRGFARALAARGGARVAILADGRVDAAEAAA